MIFKSDKTAQSRVEKIYFYAVYALMLTGILIGSPTASLAQEAVVLAPKLTYQFVDKDGHVHPVRGDNDQWFIGQDVFITYEISNPNDFSVQNITLNYEIYGMFPYEFSIETSGTVGAVSLDGYSQNLLIQEIGPSSTFNIHVKTVCTEMGYNRLNVSHRVPDEDDPNGWDGQVSFRFYGMNLPGYDIETSFTPLTGMTHPGGFVIYLGTINNNGPGVAQNVISRFTPNNQGRIFQSNILGFDYWGNFEKTYNPGKTRYVIFINRAVPEATNPSVCGTTMTVTSDLHEFNLLNNTAYAPVPCATESDRSSDLALSPTAIPTKGNVERPMDFAFDLINTGTAPIHHAYVTFDVPLVCGKISNIQCDRGDILKTDEFILITNINIAPNESLPITCSITPTSPGSMWLTARLSSEIYDTNLDNNYGWFSFSNDL